MMSTNQIYPAFKNVTNMGHSRLMFTFNNKIISFATYYVAAATYFTRASKADAERMLVTS